MILGPREDLSFQFQAGMSSLWKDNAGPLPVPLGWEPRVVTLKSLIRVAE